jgi:hypothetical protein
MGKKIVCRLDTKIFIDIWRYTHNNQKTWEDFVNQLYFNDTIKSNNTDNSSFNHKDHDTRFRYLSDKAYSKCMAIRKKLGNPPLPTGYELRPGLKNKIRKSIDWDKEKVGWKFHNEN